MASKITKALIFENPPEKLKSDLSTISGGVLRILDSGKNEKIPEIKIPSNNPFVTATQDIPNVILTGMKFPNKTGTTTLTHEVSGTRDIFVNSMGMVEEL